MNPSGEEAQNGGQNDPSGQSTNMAHMVGTNYVIDDSNFDKDLKNEDRTPYANETSIKSKSSRNISNVHSEKSIGNVKASVKSSNISNKVVPLKA